jgi:hypothetical protein
MTCGSTKNESGLPTAAAAAKWVGSSSNHHFDSERR